MHTKKRSATSKPASADHYSQDIQQKSGNKKAEEEADKDTEKQLAEIKKIGEKSGSKVRTSLAYKSCQWHCLHDLLVQNARRYCSGFADSINRSWTMY